MHNTLIKLKDGREFNAPILLNLPEKGYLKLFGVEEKLFFKDMISAITESVRLNEESDEIKLAKKYLKDARKFNWHKNLPIQEWENDNSN